MVKLFKKKWYVSAIAVTFMVALISCATNSAGKSAATDSNRIRVVSTQADMDAITGFTGKWAANSVVGFLNKDVRQWKAADTGDMLDGVVIAKGANVKVCLPGENIPLKTVPNTFTFFVPAGKFIKVESGAKLQIWSGLDNNDFDNTTLVVGGTGTSNPAVSAVNGNSSSVSVFDASHAFAIEVASGGTFILGSDSASAVDTSGRLPNSKGKGDNAVLWLADGRSLDADGKPSPYAGSIRIDGEFRVSSAAGAGVAKIRTVRNLATGSNSTLIGKGKLAIYGLNKEQGNAIFAINEFDRGEYSDGMEWNDTPSITLGTIEIIAEGKVGIYNPDGTVDGSPGYRNNANAGFYYVAGSGNINVAKMIVRSNNVGVTADATVAFANFNTDRGILGGKVTQTGPKVLLGEVEVYNAAADDKDGALSAIYTVQGTIDATVAGSVKVQSPNGGAASIVATGHNRWTGAEKTKSTMGSVEVTAKGRNAFFQSNTFEGYGTYVKGNVTVSGYNTGKITPFVGAVPPGPDMGKGGNPGTAPEAEDVRNEQFVVQGGEVSIGGKVSVENTATKESKNYNTIVSNEKNAKTTVGSLVINGIAISASDNSKSESTGQVRFVNDGVFTIKK